VPTDIDFLIQIIDSDSFIQGSANTTYLETFQPVYPEGEEALEREMALTAAILENQARSQHSSCPSETVAGQWRAQAWREQMR
jgi:acetyl/propionyl-CoA carboxylase alpha subunit